MGMDQGSLSLAQLASMLEMRRQSARPTHLLLSSRLTLPPPVLKRICGSDRWDDFRRALAGQFTRDKLLLLSSALSQENQQATYQALAQLIHAGYFGTVLTTGLDSTLENSLLDLGMRGNDLRICIVNRETPEQIAEALDNRGNELLLLKLHGSLQEQILPKRFPTVLELPALVRESLIRYCRQNLLIVGSLDQDDDLRQIFSTLATDALHYVPSAKDAGVNHDDFLLHMMETQSDARRRVLFPQASSSDAHFFLELQAGLSHLSSRTDRDEARKDISPRLHAAHVSTATPESTDILLVTATEVETTALHERVGKTPPVKVINSRSYFHLGAIAGARIWHMQTEMGSSGLAGSHIATAAAIQDLAPRAIILLGIAGGTRPKSQAIGDILVSQRLMISDRLRFGTNHETQALEVRSRGERIMASTRLLNRFRSGQRAIEFAAWERLPPPRVIFGLMLSGDFLIDHQPILDQLLKLEPDAIGYEMEAAGLYYAAAPFRTDWIVIKAISDFGNGFKQVDKAINQLLAARHAARFVMEILAQGGF